MCAAADEGCTPHQRGKHESARPGLVKGPAQRSQTVSAKCGAHMRRSPAPFSAYISTLLLSVPGMLWRTFRPHPRQPLALAHTWPKDFLNRLGLDSPLVDDPK